MKEFEMLNSEDLDVDVAYPQGLVRLIEQKVFDLEPWHLLERAHGRKRLVGLRSRYKKRYVPFAWRQDNDDIACIDPEKPDQVVIVHDFASEGTELRQEFPSFWDWFRFAIEDMIAFE